MFFKVNFVFEKSNTEIISFFVLYYKFFKAAKKVKFYQQLLVNNKQNELIKYKIKIKSNITNIYISAYI